MSIIIPANSAAGGGLGYQVTNSCRFNSADSSKMSKTSSSAGNSYKGTLSAWVKRSSLGSQQIIGRQDSNYARVIFNSNDTLRCYGNTSAENNAFDLVTTRKFTDFSAWYHIVFAWDTTQSTASNRNKIYVNGVQQTSFTTETNNPQNTSIGGGYFANSAGLFISGKTGDYFDGYMAEIVGIENTTYGPTAFGEFDEDSGIWKPLETVEDLTFGTNGFYLNFKDASNLGNDANGGTDFTETNIVTTDQSTDTCTNNGATLMITGKDSVGSYIWVDVLSEGNLLGTSSGGQPYSNYVSTVALTTGKWYWESTVIMSGSTNANSGLGVKIANYAQRSAWNSDSGSYYFSTTGKKGNAQTPATNYGSAISNGNMVGVAYDATNGTIWFSINGSWQNSATLSEIAAGTTTNAAFSSMPSGAYLPFCTDATSTRTFSYGFNFGSPFYAISSGNADSNGFGNFEYEVPAGFLSICSLNLSKVLS